MASFQEAPISEEDVIKAGGLGAVDSMGSVLPTAIDATDLEAMDTSDDSTFQDAKEAFTYESQYVKTTEDSSGNLNIESSVTAGVISPGSSRGEDVPRGQQEQFEGKWDENPN